jgi:DNA-binding LacI/PurR family transcriptional regulator
MARRPTMSDIALSLGISKSAVSYALNDRPGVGPEVRDRVLAAAREMGWHASSSARALSNARAGVIGIVMVRPPELLAIEPYFTRLVAGIESVLIDADVSLLLRLTRADSAAELLVYERWWGEGRVDGVILLDERYQDPRIALVERLGLPAVLCGGPHSGSSVVSLWPDEVADAARIVGHLVAQGHRRIAHVSGPRNFMHERRRRRGVRTAASRAGLEKVLTIESDYTGAVASRCTREILAGPEPPTAIIYGSDVMATSSLAALTGMGVRVPDELSLISWDDSSLCTLVHPSLTALSKDVTAYGARAARTLLGLMAGQPARSQREPDYELTVRESSAWAPARPDPRLPGLVTVP